MSFRLLLLLACGAVAVNTASAQARLGGRVHDGHDATSQPLTDIIQDGSFEAGSPNPFWDEASTNFGTPLCTIAACGGTGQGTGPRTGDWWAWFGGIAQSEEGSLSQDVTIEPGDATLTFYLEVPACDTDQDYLEVLVDDNQEFVVNGASSVCGSVGYMEQTIDLSSYADGGTHTVEFHSEVFGAGGNVSNFFIEDVMLDNTPTAIEAGPDGTPGTHALSDAYPNPFTGRTQLSLEVAETQAVRVEVYNALGQRVATLHDGALAAGTAHRFTLDGAGLAAGVYVVRVTGEDFTDARTLTLTR